jgi:hypothetical protein
LIADGSRHGKSGAADDKPATCYRYVRLIDSRHHGLRLLNAGTLQIRRPPKKDITSSERNANFESNRSVLHGQGVNPDRLPFVRRLHRSRRFEAPKDHFMMRSCTGGLSSDGGGGQRTQFSGEL